jgi:ABC-type phosphate transport system auxiliary subunit
MSRETYAVTVEDWRSLGKGLEANAADNPRFEAHRLQLQEMTARATDLVAQRNALEAQKQTVTSELQALLAEGRKVASLLRGAMKATYGNRSEKLVEFGMRPFRRRSASSDEPSV